MLKYNGSLCTVNIPNRNPAYKIRSKKANYKRGLLRHKFPSDTLVFLKDCMALAKELSEFAPKTPAYIQKKQVLVMQLKTVINKLLPKFVIRFHIKGNTLEQLDCAMTYYKALQVKDTMQLRIKYFECLGKAINSLK